jgi:hypothetical protein
MFVWYVVVGLMWVHTTGTLSIPMATKAIPPPQFYNTVNAESVHRLLLHPLRRLYLTQHI